MVDDLDFGANCFNLVKSQSREHAMEVECSSINNRVNHLDSPRSPFAGT
jgi:hypothetical protein